MKRTTLLVMVVAFLMGMTQVASASFCPLFGKSKKSNRPPMMRPAYPMVALLPVQATARAPAGMQAVYLVPAYPVPPRFVRQPPRYYRYR